MSIQKILSSRHQLLHEASGTVVEFDISLGSLVDDLVDTMRAAKGKGLAAPQIGVRLRVAVIASGDSIITLVNPKIVKMRGECEPDEGCLSVLGFRGRPRRAERITLKAMDHRGRAFQMKATGLIAQAIQHEVDHLDGILFTSRLADPSRLRAKTVDEMQIEAGRRNLIQP